MTEIWAKLAGSFIVLSSVAGVLFATRESHWRAVFFILSLFALCVSVLGFLWSL